MLFRRHSKIKTTRASGPWTEVNAEDILTYEILAQRELEKDAMLWQTPTIALTAQAFLLTIALDPGSPIFATYLSASLGILIAGMSMQLMAKHRALNAMDRSHLHFLEDRLGINHLSNRSYFYPNGEFQVPDFLASHRPPSKPNRFTQASSYAVWMRGLSVFLIINFLIIAVQFFAPQWLQTVGV